MKKDIWFWTLAVLQGLLLLPFIETSLPTEIYFVQGFAIRFVPFLLIICIIGIEYLIYSKK